MRCRLGGGHCVNKLRREMVDQLQWGERQHSGAVALGSRQPIDDLL